MLCVVPSYWPAFIFGGPVFSVHAMNKALVAKGVEVTVYTTAAGLSGKVPLNLSVDVDGVKVTYFSHLRSLDFLTATGWQFSPRLSSALKRGLSAFDAVYIVGAWNYPTIIAADYCRRHKIPYIVSPRGLLYPYSMKKGFWRKKLLYELFVKSNFSRAQGVHYTTEDEAQKCHSSLGFKNKPFVIPLGIDPEEFDKLPGRLAMEGFYPQLKGKKVVLFLGRITWKKGLDILIKAFANLAKTDDTLHLLIAGNDEAGYISKVRGWIDDFGVSGKVTLPGLLRGEKKAAVLSGSDVFVLPSYSENFGIAVLEAMAAGLAVIISDQVGIYQDIAKHQAGLVVSAEVSSLEKGMQKMLNDQGLRKKMIDNAIILVKDKFSLDRMAVDMVGMFEQSMVYH